MVTAHFAAVTTQWELYTSQWLPLNGNCTLHSGYNTMVTVHFTMVTHNVNSTLHNGYHTMETVHFAMDTTQ